MLTKLRFITDWRCFKKNEEIVLKPFTMLCGDQGTGKSSILQAIQECANDSSDPLRVKGLTSKQSPVEVCTDKPTETMMFDFERHNPRMSSHVSHGFEVFSHFKSHGEMVNMILDELTAPHEHCCFMLDEPDMALSIPSILKLIKMTKECLHNGHQIIAAVHNPILIQSADDVFDMEKRKWITPVRFFKRMGLPVNIPLTFKGKAR